MSSSEKKLRAVLKKLDDLEKSLLKEREVAIIRKNNSEIFNVEAQAHTYLYKGRFGGHVDVRFCV